MIRSMGNLQGRGGRGGGRGGRGGYGGRGDSIFGQGRGRGRGGGGGGFHNQGNMATLGSINTNRSSIYRGGRRGDL